MGWKILVLYFSCALQQHNLGNRPVKHGWASLQLYTSHVAVTSVTWFHFSRRCNDGRYSFNHLRLGLPLIMDSTSHINVWRLSSFSICSWSKASSKACITFLTVRIHRSQIPPWCDAVGGLKIHLMSLNSSNWWILSWFQSLTQLRNSFSPLTKFPPLSDLISSGLPLLATNRLKAFKKESVTRLGATSIWIARTVRHVNITPYLFTKLRPRRILNGPKQSTPVYVNGGLHGVTRLLGIGQPSSVRQLRIAFVYNRSNRWSLYERAIVL